MAESGRIAGIVLAAGFSRRLGRPKQAVVLGGETLLQRAARTALEAGLHPVIVVLNAELPEAGGPLPGCIVLWNESAAEGMASSIRCGVQGLAGHEVAGAVLMTCDQVAVTPEHLRTLSAQPSQAAGSGYASKVGVPAYFPVNRFAELLALQGDQGARGMLRDARPVETEALALDVDTDEELARAERWVRGL